MESKNLKSKIVSGLIWNVVQLAVNKFFAFIVKLVLAKILFPEDFGLVGMAIVFISFVQVFNELGIGAAIVQRKEEHLREAHYHTVFWTGVIWSVAVYLLLVFVMAPLASNFYQQPLLRQIIPFLSLGVLSSPVNLIHRAQLTRQMNFKRLALINNISGISAGLLSLTLAILGAGIWSLVFNTLAGFFIAMPLFFITTRWTPKLIWEKEAFNDIFGFGMYTSGSNLLNNLLSNLDYLLIGKLVSAHALGVYTFAFVLTDTFRGQIFSMINNVMYPVYGIKQDDPQALKNYYLKVVLYNSLIMFPVMVFFISLGEPFILTLFGDKWMESVILMKILAFSVIIHTIVGSHASLIRGMGYPRLEMKLQMIKVVLVFAPFLFVGVYYFGVLGAAVATVCYKLVEVILAQYYLRKLVHVTIQDILVTIKAPFLAGLAAFALSSFLYNSGLHAIICGLALFVCYGALVWWIMSDEIKSQVAVLTRKRQKQAV